MKNYDETISTVFDRINEYEVEKKRKRKAITKAAASLCLVAIIGVGLGASGLFKATPPAVSESDSKDEQNVSTNNDEPSGTSKDLPIIWGEQSDEGIGDWKGKTVGSSLKGVLLDDANKNSLIAISVLFEIDEQYVHNGKTLKDYGDEGGDEYWVYRGMHILWLHGDDLKYGEKLYTTGLPNGEKWHKTFYDETIEDIGKDIIEKYIVDGEFLKEQLEADIEAFEWPCRIAYEEALKASLKNTRDKAIKILEENGIKYELRRAYGAYGLDYDYYIVFFATAETFEALSLEDVLAYDLTSFDGSPMGVDE